jgi:hypothetical protein
MQTHLMKRPSLVTLITLDFKDETFTALVDIVTSVIRLIYLIFL